MDRHSVIKVMLQMAFEAFQFIINWNEQISNTEYNVVRCVNAVLIAFFAATKFPMSVVPQYYTEEQAFPDFAVESWRLPKDGERAKFIPRVFIEFKSINGGNTVTAMIQTKFSLRSEFRRKYAFTGILIAVSGNFWLFMDYTFVYKSYGRSISKTFTRSLKKRITSKCMRWNFF